MFLFRHYERNVLVRRNKVAYLTFNTDVDIDIESVLADLNTDSLIEELHKRGAYYNIGKEEVFTWATGKIWLDGELDRFIAHLREAASANFDRK